MPARVPASREILAVSWRSIAPFLTLALGLVLGACGSEPPTATPGPTALLPATPPPTAPAPAPPAPPTDTPEPADPFDAALVDQALNTTLVLQSYHYTVVADSDSPPQHTTLEGDVIRPDREYVHGAVNGRTVESLKIAGTAYYKSAGAWRVVPQAGAPTFLQPATALRSMLDGGVEILNTQADEVLDGARVRHYLVRLNSPSLQAALLEGVATPPPDAPSSAFTAGLWIDPGPQYLHKLTIDVDIATAPGSASLHTRSMLTISRHNDPGISIPTP